VHFVETSAVGEQVVTLRVTGVAAGGDGLAREDTGRVVFVEGALPGEQVRAAVVDERRDYARATVTDVLDASPDRVEPPCVHVLDGCGGCDWQHIDPPAQRQLKADLVADALRRGAHLEVEVASGPDLVSESYRTTLRGVALGGRFSLRRRSTHDPVPLDLCVIAHPLIEELIVDGRFPDGEVVLRAGARTGERLVIVDGDPAATVVPDGTRVVGSAELRQGRRAWFHEEVDGHTLRISARSFFQARPDGADALVALVREAVADRWDGRMNDLYGGVGLFAATLGAGEGSTLVETSASALADARVNLAGTGTRVVEADVTRWRHRRAPLVVADPPRAGLGRKGVAVVGRTGAQRLVLVSCDAAALGRDTALLVDDGWSLTSCTAVDLFPQTSHVEVVSRFDRAGARPAAPS
jgi:23S rRNA (uracil1939-C5)-methyltransferase